MFSVQPSPEGRGWREAPGEGYNFFPKKPSPKPHRTPLKDFQLTASDIGNRIRISN